MPEKQRIVTCHKYVASVAQAAAGEYYECLMGASNEIWKEWKRQHPDLNAKQLENEFVKRMWPKCIEFARGTLAMMLGRKDISDEMKAEIYEVLQLDRSLMVGMPIERARVMMDAEIMRKQGGRLN